MSKTIILLSTNWAYSPEAVNGLISDNDEITPQDGNFAPPFVRSLLTSTSREIPHEPFTWQKDTSPRRVPRASRQGAREGGLPCLACKGFNAFSKERYEKLALPGWLD